MNMHKNARLTPLGRERLAKAMESGQTPQAAARAAGVCPRTARKWLARYKAEGVAGLQDRSSRPKKLRRPTAAGTTERIIVLRRLRRTGRHIACETGVSPATVSRVLKRAGLSRLKDLEPAEPVRRYERKAPGEMIHIDIKKLGLFDASEANVVFAYDLHDSHHLLKRAGATDDELEDHLKRAEAEVRPRALGILREANINPDDVILKPALHNAHDPVLDAAKSVMADVIVVGTKRKKAFERFRIGSVSEAILRRAECDVLVIPPAD